MQGADVGWMGRKRAQRGFIQARSMYGGVNFKDGFKYGVVILCVLFIEWFFGFC
jgi:hypothetical protein